MQNILDYLDWRGDISFEKDGFNEVDNLILSTLSYLDYGGIIPEMVEEDAVTLSEIIDRVVDSVDENSVNYQNPFFKPIPDLFIKVAQSVRFGDVRISCYVNQVDHEHWAQFSAVVFSFHKEKHYVAFRGTDDTLAGWKEDFLMSFMDEVQAQRDAVDYLKYIVPYFDGELYLGGHSKGGNLAVYAASYMEETVRKRIPVIYNNDGPGFQGSFLKNVGYKNILSRISTIIPKSSIVGLLFEHREGYTIVNSDEKGIMQHNVFSWEVKGTHFVYHEQLEKSSIHFNKALRLWLKKLPLLERSQFVDALFNIIYASGAMTISELTVERLAAVEGMIKSYKNLEPETKKFLKKTIRAFFRERQKVLRYSVGMDINLLLSRKKEKAEPEEVAAKEKTEHDS